VVVVKAKPAKTVVKAFCVAALKRASESKIAGLEMLRIVNESTAASLVYGLKKKNNETIMEFDLGGGTFDVSVLEAGDGVCEVLSKNGDTHLGGDDFDKTIVDWLAEEFQRKEGQTLSYLACKKPRSPYPSSLPM